MKLCGISISLHRYKLILRSNLTILLLTGFLMGCEVYATEHLTQPDIESPLEYLLLGLYTVPIESFSTVKEAGFNTVHIYHDTQSLSEAKQYLEAAEDLGLKVSQNMPRDYLSEGDGFWIDWVTSLSVYDNLVMWYLPEEPDVRGVAHNSLARLYEIVKQYDPQDRPVALYFGGTQNLEIWCDVADIILIGCYPEYHGEPRACIKTRIDIAREACPSKPVMGVPPFFDSRDFDHPGGYPTPHQARFDAYTSLIAGAKGLNWFCYQNGARLSELWSELQNIVAELNELAPVIISPNSLQSAKTKVISGPLHVSISYGGTYDSIQILQKGPKGNYLFATNLSPESVESEFSGLPMDVYAVDVLYENRTIQVSRGSFRDMFAGLDVHIYQFRTSSTYLDTLESSLE